MSFVIDGITTKMRPIQNPHGASVFVDIECPCGWVRANVPGDQTSEWAREHARTAMEALRFHYTHCNQARHSPTSKAANSPYDASVPRLGRKNMT